MKNTNLLSSAKLFILFILMFQSLIGEILNTSIEFSVPWNQTNDPHEPYTPLVRFNSNTYLAWVDLNQRPMITQQKCDKSLVTVPLDLNPDYKALDDGHNRFSMGIDKNGYIHVTGDMHYYPTNTSYLPARYKDQSTMYWVSNVPYDITKGFTFAGGKNATTTIPGHFYVNGYFLNDNNNELYFTSMVRGVYNQNKRLTGEMAVGLYKYNTATRTWTALGAKPPKLSTHPEGTIYWEAIFWENAGFGSPAGSPQWFNNYQACFQFDNQNNLHMSVAITVDTNITGPTRAIYAVSKDGGVTWSKANGKNIALPIRGIDSAPNIGDLVVDVANQSNPRVNVEAYVTADSNGKPLVNYGLNNVWDVYWKWFNGSSWVSTINNPHQISGKKGFLGPDGKISINGYQRAGIFRTSSANNFSSFYTFDRYLDVDKINEFLCISHSALKTTNDIYGIGFNKDKKYINVIKFDFTEKGLPCNWSSTDLGRDIVYGGSCDFDNGTYTIRSAGSGFKNAAYDSLHFGYRQLTGNGTLIARIKSQDLIFNFPCGDGIMMRESLTDDSKFIFMGSNVQSVAGFYYRTLKSGNSASTLLSNNSSKWLKVDRLNNQFSGFISNDGVTWSQVGTTQTISMGQTIYVGIASYTNHIYDLHNSTFDNLNLIS